MPLPVKCTLSNAAEAQATVTALDSLPVILRFTNLGPTPCAQAIPSSVEPVTVNPSTTVLLPSPLQHRIVTAAPEPSMVVTSGPSADLTVIALPRREMLS